MKKNVLVAGTLGAMLALAGCGGGTVAEDSPDSGSIVVQGYSGIFQDNFQKAVIDPFQEKFPNIKVEYRGIATSADNLASLRSEKNSPTIDVTIMDLSLSDTANKSDLLQPLDPAKVPNMKDIDERGQVDGNFGPAITFDSLVLIYNDKVNPPPTEWQSLWDPKYKGRVIVPAHPDIQGTGLMLIENAKAGADFTQSVDAGVTRLQELAPSVQTWDPQPDQYTLVQSGTADLAVAWNARAQFYADESQGAMKVAIVDDQTIFQINTINLVKDAPSPEAAQTFINYALDPQTQSNFTETMYYAPTNTKAQPNPEALKRTSADPEKIDNVLDVDWTAVATNREDWTQIWRRQILAGG
jgi:putative spermidine/putrescine transport system substrate-binding protein